MGIRVKEKTYNCPYKHVAMLVGAFYGWLTTEEKHYLTPTLRPLRM